MSTWSDDNARIAASADPETNEMFDRTTSSDGSRRVQNTDLGNSRRLVAAHGSRVRYAPEWGVWLPWDGRRWAPDVTGQIDRFAKQVAESILDQARAGGDKDLFGWGLRSQSRAGIANMIKLAETEPGIPVLVDQLDADPWLFNTMSGTVDLRSGETRTHSKKDLITKLAPVAYDPAAECPTWDRFLQDVFGDEDLIGFVRRAAGYSLTGHTLEQILIFCFGTGGNGKTTFLNVLRAVFGDYGMQLDPAVLTLSAHEQHPTGLTDLRGARFVATIETEMGKRLNEALVKQLTGSDPIRARRMHKDFFEFLPTHKLWFAGNHLPKINGTDYGIWRRLALLPFTAQFAGSRADRQMGERLTAEAPGILGWAVRGCLEWQQDGLGIPDAVTNATADYRQSQDHVGRFLADTTIAGPTYYVKTGDLRAAYEAWCKEEGETVWSARAVARELKGRGLDNTSMGRGDDKYRVWIGLGLLTGAPEAPCA